MRKCSEAGSLVIYATSREQGLGEAPEPRPFSEDPSRVKVAWKIFCSDV